MIIICYEQSFEKKESVNDADLAAKNRLPLVTFCLTSIIYLILGVCFMKKILLIVTMLVFAQNAKADICAFVDKQVAEKAVEILQKQSEIIDYCSLCASSTPQTIEIKTVEIQPRQLNDKNYSAVEVNKIGIDLAYIYLKKGKRYENLAYLSGCKEVKKHDIHQFEDNFLKKKKMSKEEMYKKSKDASESMAKKCMDTFFVKENPTTHDSLVASTQANDCIAEAIKQEIKKGFEPEEQKEMLQYLTQLRKPFFHFYDKIYNSNKYCIGQCGTTAQLYPYEDEAFMLEQMFERLKFLNITKNGY